MRESCYQWHHRTMKLIATMFYKHMYISLEKSRLFWQARIGLKMLLANFNLANTCALHTTPLHTIMRVRTCVFGGINFGELVKNLPIRQIKIPTKVSGYMVYMLGT